MLQKIRYIIENNKKKTLIFLSIIIFIILSYNNTIKNYYKKIYFDNLKKKDIEYIMKTSQEASDLFLKLSLAKGILAVIEGSTINVDAVIGGEIEVGDIVQPVYDSIDIIWKVSLFSTVSLKIQNILLKNIKLKFFSNLITLSLTLLIPYLFFPSRLTIFLSRISKSIFIISMLIYFLFPTAIFFNSLAADYTNKTYKLKAISSLENEIKKLEKVKAELFKLEKKETEKNSIFNLKIKDKLGEIKEKFIKINNSLREISANVIKNLPVIITVYVFNTMLLPLIILFILYKIMIFIILNEII